MNYLLDKKIKRNKYFKYTFFVIFLFVLIFFRVSIFNGLSYVSHLIFRPVLILGSGVSEKLSSIGAYFYSKKSLSAENENLKLKLAEQEAKISDYNSVISENLEIKEILGRKQEKANMILAAILAKPNRSLYDTLVIDIGTKNGIQVGQRVFGLGNIPIGRVTETYLASSKVVLYSSPGEKTEVIIGGKDTFMQIVGRGGGNFEMILPRDFVLEKGTTVSLPGLTSYTIGIVQTIISDPRDSFQKALLSSPVNIFELKFVEVEK